MLLSHTSRDLSCRDDLWSLFYILVEMISGDLPWARIKDRDKIAELKAAFHTSALMRQLPEELTLFREHLQSLEYYDKPDYIYLHGLLNRLSQKAGGEEEPYDWEKDAPAATRAAAGTAHDRNAPAHPVWDRRSLGSSSASFSVFSYSSIPSSFCVCFFFLLSLCRSGGSA